MIARIEKPVRTKRDLRPVTRHLTGQHFVGNQRALKVKTGRASPHVNPSRPQGKRGSCWPQRVHDSDFLEMGKLIDLETPQQIYEAGREIQEVYFPIDAVLSVVTEMRDGGSIEVGTVGREGVSAIPLLLGATTSANESYCQVPGRAVVIDSDYFRQLLRADDAVSGRAGSVSPSVCEHAGQLAACNRTHNLYQRCARWLLLTHDRVNSDKIALTHEYLAMMLGSRRSGVTIAASTLQRAGFIRYAHGHIMVLDRQGLEEASCECYAVAREQFGPLLGMIELTKA